PRHPVAPGPGRPLCRGPGTAGRGARAGRASDAPLRPGAGDPRRRPGARPSPSRQPPRDAAAVEERNDADDRGKHAGYEEHPRDRGTMKGSLVVSAVLAAFPVCAAAQDFQVGSRAKAMGGSYTAFGDDPVAIWTNPAGTATQNSQVAITYQSFT